MIKLIATGFNSIGMALLVISIGTFSLVIIQFGPLWIIVRNTALSLLGEPTPGLTIEGDNRPPTLDCDHTTGNCRVEE